MKIRVLSLLTLLCLSFAVQAQLLWNKTYGTASTDQFMTRMIALSNGGYLMVGNQRISSPVNHQTTLAIRTNVNGDTIWTRKYLPTGWINIVVSDAAEDTDNNLILVGSGRLATVNDYNGFILKLNPNGDTIWTKKLITNQSDGYYNIIIGNDGNYIVNGEESGFPVIKKINKSGQNMWARSVTFSPTDAGFVSNFTRTQNGYFVFVGTNSPSIGKVVKLTEAGIEQQSYFNFAVAVYDVFSKTNFSMVACSGPRLYEFNALGDTLWSKRYVMNTQPLSLTAAKPTPDGNYITLFDRRNGNDGDVGLMKVAPNGTVIKDTLLFRFGYNEYGKNIVVDANGNYVFAGHAEVTGSNKQMFLAKHREWKQGLGVKEDKELTSAVKVYPNPATNQAIIESEKLLSGTLVLYNLQGKQVWLETVTITTKKIVPLQNLPFGIYILRFVSESRASFSRKIVKQ